MAKLVDIQVIVREEYMKALNIHQAKANFSTVLIEVEKHHESFLIYRNGKPVADLVPHKKKSRLKADPFLSKVKISCDLTEPLTQEDWNV